MLGEWVSIVNTPLGWVYVVVSSRGVRVLGIVSSCEQATLQVMSLQFSKVGAPSSVSPVWVTDQVQGYLSGCRLSGLKLANCAIDWERTPFQREVYRQVCAIEPGCVQRYHEVAQAMGRVGAQRAVARALSANRVALIIPCHRVVAQKDGLGGYRWGCAVKQQLLTLEHEGWVKNS